MAIRFTRQQAIDYDRACVQEFGIPPLVLMTHAAVECATVIRKRLPCLPPLVVALCGGGNNGGDGYAIARTLHSWGVHAMAIEVTTPRANSDAHTMRDAAAAHSLVHPWSEFAGHIPSDGPLIIVDALFGTGLTRAPCGRELEAIHWINARGARVVSIDLPSGMDCDLGVALGGPHDMVRANETLTMVCEKAGFSNPRAREFLGIVTVVPIGGPPLTQDPQTVE